MDDQFAVEQQAGRGDCPVLVGKAWRLGGECSARVANMVPKIRGFELLSQGIRNGAFDTGHSTKGDDNSGR